MIERGQLLAYALGIGAAVLRPVVPRDWRGTTPAGRSRARMNTSDWSDH